MLLTTYPEIPAGEEHPVSLGFEVGGEYPAVISSNVDHVYFRTPWAWSHVHALHFWEASDSISKTNVREIPDALAKVLSLKGHKYEMAEGKAIGGTTRLGFVAQELAQILPEATDSINGYLMVNYSQVIPLLVESIKSLSNALDEMKQMADSMQARLNVCCNREVTEGVNIEGLNTGGTSRLYQNRPNPFRESTVIEYELVPGAERNAAILIFDLNGELKQSLRIATPGHGFVEVKAGELRAGMYLYTLVVNGEEAATRRMILTQ